jgi:hypothetical protein
MADPQVCPRPSRGNGRGAGIVPAGDERGQAPSPRLARHLDQGLVAGLGDIDGCENAACRRRLVRVYSVLHGSVMWTH